MKEKCPLNSLVRDCNTQFKEERTPDNCQSDSVAECEDYIDGAKTMIGLGAIKPTEHEKPLLQSCEECAKSVRARLDGKN